MEKSRKLMHRITHFFEIVAVFCLVSMVVFVFFNASIRYLFSYGLNQTEELSRFCFIWLAFLGTVLAYQRKEHIIIPFGVERLSGKPKMAVQCLARIITSAAFAFLFYSAWIYTRVAFTYTSDGTGINFGLVVMVLPIMSGCILLMDIFDLITFISGYARTGKLPEAEKEGDG